MPRRLLTGADVNSQKIINLADGSSPSDAATVGQMQSWLNGLAFKDDVRAATTANGTLATAYANGQTVDGVSLVTGDRILIKNQTTQTENGVYTVNASGAPTRAVDADTAIELNQATVRVRLGTVNVNTQWTQTTDSVVIGSSNIVWVPSGGSATYIAGAGLTESPANTFNVGAGTGITVAADAVAIDPAYTGLSKRFTVAIGDGSTTAITVTHNLGTRDVIVGIYDAATFVEVEADVVHTTTNTLTVTFATAPASGAYRVVVIG